MVETDPNIDRFLERATSWKTEMLEIRRLCLDSKLREEMKWGKPCYSIQGGNVAITQPFKDYCALMFFKGSLLKDEENILFRVGERSRAAKQLRFTSVEQIREQELIVRAYLSEAIELEKAGAKVDFGIGADIEVPDEFQQMLDDDPQLQQAFESLTPGRQREYLIYFSDAKQSKTRAARVEKFIPHILEGKGFRE